MNVSKRREPTERFSIPSATNALIVLLQLLAYGFCLFLLRKISGWLELLALATVFAVVMNSVYSSIHEAHHRILFAHRRLNDWAGIFLALLFPAPFHLLREGHLGHHRRNRTDDEVFDLYFEYDKPWLKKFLWYGILTGLYWLLIAVSNLFLAVWPGVLESRIFSVDRTSEIFLKHFKKETHRLIQLEAIAVLLFQAGLLFFLAVPALKYFLLYYGFGLSWSSLQYIHHYQAERDVIDGARNLSFWKPIDLIWLNHNLHQTHHQVPTASWIHLNRLASEKETKASPLIPAYFRLWRGPQAAESGHSKVFDGEVSR